VSRHYRSSVWWTSTGDELGVPAATAMGEGSPPGGRSVSRATMRRALRDGAGRRRLRLLVRENTVEDCTRMMYTSACTSTNTPTFISAASMAPIPTIASSFRTTKTTTTSPCVDLVSKSSSAICEESGGSSLDYIERRRRTVTGSPVFDRVRARVGRYFVLSPTCRSSV
jgi:hypothetical protein